MRVRIDGLRELEAALAQLPKAVGKRAVRGVLRTRGQIIADAAIGLAPDDPATTDRDLKSSIAVSTRQKTGRAFKEAVEGPAAVHMYVGVSTNIRRYSAAIAQEFGTVKHGPQPFMRPAWDSTQGQVLDGIADDLGQAIDKAAKRHAKRMARIAAKG